MSVRFVKKFLISLLPIFLLTLLVFYEIKKEVSLVDLQKPEKIFTVEKEKTQEENSFQSKEKETNKADILPYPKGLEIKGDEDFKKQITQALKLIWIYDRETFLFIKKNVFEIRNENRTTFYTDDTKPIIAISNTQAYESLTWVAGVIAHNAWHAYYELRKKQKRKKEIPLPGKESFFSDDKFPNPLEREYKTLDDLFRIEEYASQFQVKILEEIGAPRAEIKKIQNRKRNDFSISHDGNYIVNP